MPEIQNAGSLSGLQQACLVVASFLVQVVVLGLIYSYGTLFAALKADTGDAASSIRDLVFSLGAAPAGFLVQRVGFVRMAAIGAGLLLLGMLADSYAPSSYFLFISCSLVGGVGMTMTFIPALTVLYGPGHISPSFLPVAVGLAMSAGGLGTVVVNLGLNLLLDSFSWRGALRICCGAFGLLSPTAVCFLGGSVVQSSPQQSGQRTYQQISRIEKPWRCPRLLTAFRRLAVPAAQRRFLPLWHRLHGALHATCVLCGSREGTGHFRRTNFTAWRSRYSCSYLLRPSLYMHEAFEAFPDRPARGGGILNLPALLRRRRRTEGLLCHLWLLVRRPYCSVVLGPERAFWFTESSTPLWTCWHSAARLSLLRFRTVYFPKTKQKTHTNAMKLIRQKPRFMCRPLHSIVGPWRYGGLQSVCFLGPPSSAKSMTSLATMTAPSSRQAGPCSWQSRCFTLRRFVGDPSKDLRPREQQIALATLAPMP